MTEYLRVLLLGSRRFYKQIEHNKKVLIKAGIDAFTPEKPPGKLTKDEELEAKLRFYHRIKIADVVYFHTPGGYFGEDSIDDQAYAYACSKEIILWREISPNTKNYKFNSQLRSRVMDRDELIKYCKNGNHR
jgi:hypothetical protein